MFVNFIHTEKEQVMHHEYPCQILGGRLQEFQYKYTLQVNFE